MILRALDCLLNRLVRPVGRHKDVDNMRINVNDVQPKIFDFVIYGKRMVKVAEAFIKIRQIHIFAESGLIILLAQIAFHHQMVRLG